MRFLLPIFLAGMTATGSAVLLQEDFASEPAARGWLLHGDTNLFHWNATHQNLRVTWDSSKTNSYFHLPLNHVLTRSDSFEAAFDVYLEEIDAGTTAGKPKEFPLAVSLFNLSEARRTNFFIGTGVSASGAGLRSAVEFNYFPNAGFGETFSAIAVSSTPTNTSQFRLNHDYPTPLDPGHWHRITLAYTAINQQLVMTKSREGQPYGITQSITLGPTFGDFRLDTFSISSYSDKIGLGSIRAQGVIDNVRLTLPDPPISNLTLASTNAWRAQVQFQSSAGWNYTLERSPELREWSVAAPALAGTGELMTLADTNAPVERAFYRVRAARP